MQVFFPEQCIQKLPSAKTTFLHVLCVLYLTCVIFAVIAETSLLLSSRRSWKKLFSISLQTEAQAFFGYKEEEKIFKAH